MGDHDQVVELLVELGWSTTTTTRCTAKEAGPGVECFWIHLPAVDVRLCSYDVLGEPATVRNLIRPRSRA